MQLAQVFPDGLGNLIDHLFIQIHAGGKIHNGTMSFGSGFVDLVSTIGISSNFIDGSAGIGSNFYLINGNIQLTGDSKPLLELQSILHGLELDWEGELARLVGDVPAHELGRFVRQGLKVGRSVHESLLRQLEEYIHEEGRLLPPRAELEAFYEEVDELVQRTERLAARINRLEQG